MDETKDAGATVAQQFVVSTQDLTSEVIKDAKPALAALAAQLLGQVIGMAIDEVKKLCQEKGVDVNVASENGQGNNSTSDFRDDRLQLHLQDGVVKNASIG